VTLFEYIKLTFLFKALSCFICLCHRGKTYAILLLLLNCAAALFSQEHLFEAKVITPEDGLANLMTSAVFKDRQGFVWIGTRYGLNRYDGVTFRLYTRENNGLQSNENILRILEDESGKLWLFYKNRQGILPDSIPIGALDIFDPKTERAIPFDVYFGGKAPFKATDLALPDFADPKKRLWLNTMKGGLYRYDGTFRKIPRPEDAFFDYLTVDSADNIWTARGTSLIRVDRSGKMSGETTLPGRIGGMCPGAGQGVWLLTVNTEKVFVWYKPKDGALVPFSFHRDGRPFEIKREAFYFVHRDRKGYWFIGIDGQLNVFDRQGNWLFNYKNLATTLLNYFEDDRYLWLTTPSGLIQASVAENRFKLIHKKETGYSDCRGIAEDGSGNIYFLNTLLFRWNPKTRTYNKLNDREGAFGLFCMDSTVWAGDYTTKSLGYEVDLKTGREMRYPVLDPGIHLAYALIKTGVPGRLLAGSNKGLVYVDLRSKQLLPFEKYNGFDLLKTSEVNFFHQNATGIWLATNNGIFLMEEQAGIVRQYDMASGDLPFNDIRHIHEDKAGVFWLATKGGGIIRWRPATAGKRLSESRQFTTADGLSDNYTYAVYEDDYGKLWIPSDKGLMWIDKASFRIRTFLREDGLPHIEFNHTAHYQARDGTLYFGGLGGLIALHPKDFAAEQTNTTPLGFTGYYLLESGAAQTADKTKTLLQSDVITIRPGDKFFELHFNLLDYAPPGRHRYAYQITGYSDNWNYIGENFVRITNLPYGHYTLRIRGQHSSEGWSERDITLPIDVLKPVYLQWWFIAAVAGIVVFLVLAGVRKRVEILKKDRERLEAEVRKRTLQIEQDKQIIVAQADALQELDKAKTHFFSNITHEFRTPLTLIIGPVEQLTTSDSIAAPIRKSLSGVLKNARHLLVLINQLLDLSKLEGRQMHVKAVHGDIIGYTRDLMNRFKLMAGKKEQHLRFVPDQVVWEIHFDKNAWDKIIYNLLSNAIKFTPNGGTITLSLEQIYEDAREVIHLMVTDTGIGIRTEALDQIFNRFYQADSSSTRTQNGTGIGLALVKELVELQRGDIRVSSRIGAGTTFDIRLPVLPAEAEPQVPAPLIFPESLVMALADNEIPVPDNALADAADLSPAHPRKEKLELLIIEDNSDMRAYIRNCLHASKYYISEASDGEEGIQKARAIIPDLIVSDVMMPGKNGFEVVQEIRGQLCTSHIPLILLTAKASLESRLQGLERGADAYLTKPFSPQELALQIRNLIAIRQLLRARYQSGSAAEAEPGFQKEDAFMADLRAYITANIDEPNLNVEDLGRHFGISRTQFYRKLDALIARPIGDYIRSICLETAAQLLKERRLSIAEVAYATGFSSPSHFSRTFKKAYGKAPSEEQ